MIYEAPLVNGAYAAPVLLPKVVNSGPSDTSPFISPNGNSLLFYSTRPGGFGKADIYIAFKKHGEWTTVKNAGPQINGPDSEYNPALSPDGKTLFFGRNSNIYEVPAGRSTR
jgi:Tol biopolymer transport system component